MHCFCFVLFFLFFLIVFHVLAVVTTQSINMTHHMWIYAYVKNPREHLPLMHFLFLSLHHPTVWTQERYSKTAKGQSNLYLTQQFAPRRRSCDWVGWLLCMKMLEAVGLALCWMDVRHLMRDVKRICCRGRCIVLFGDVMVSCRLLVLA